MRFRKLRIAFSATCLIACVLLIVLWVRTRYAWDIINVPMSANILAVTSRNGGISVGLPKGTRLTWNVAHSTAPNWVMPGYSYALGFGISTAIPAIFIPYWFFVLLTVALSVLALKVPLRFTLRTLLIATTLVAVVLGLIVLAVR